MRHPSTLSLHHPPPERGDERGLNVVLLGDSKVGKTALVNRVVQDRFNESYNKTSASEVKTTNWRFNVGGKSIRYFITDLSGSVSSFSTLSSRQCLCAADVVFLCYKISDPSTLFSALNNWCPEVRAIAPRVPIILVGCQSDLRHDRDILTSLSRDGLAPVSSDQALTVSQQSNCELYVETSAKTCSRSAISAFEVAGLISLGKLQSRTPPPVPPKPSKVSPPVPPKPRRAVSHMALNKENLYSPDPKQNFFTPKRPVISTTPQSTLMSSKLSLKTSRERSSTSMLSLSSHQRTPKLSRRNHSKQPEKMITIKCQRLTQDKTYEEIEVEVPEPIYETLKFYNDKNGPALGQQQQGGGGSFNSQQELCGKTSKRSLAAKIKSIFARN